MKAKQIPNDDIRYIEKWDVESESTPGKSYTVSLGKGGTWSCSCPRWTLSKTRPTCKHIVFIETMRFSAPKGAKVVRVRKPKPVSEFSVIEL